MPCPYDLTSLDDHGRNREFSSDQMLRSGARGYKSLGLEFMASKVQDRIIKQDNNYIHYIQTRTFIHLYTNIDFGYRDIDVRSEDIISCFFP